MRIGLKIWFVFCVVWFGLKIVGVFFPPNDPVFNAALAIVAALVAYAEFSQPSRVRGE